MLKALSRLAAFCLCVALSLGLMAPAAANAAGISPDDLGVIRRQAAAFEDAKTRLPDLARLVSEKDWVFTRNLLHGPCLLYTSPSPRDGLLSRMPSSA